MDDLSFSYLAPIHHNTEEDGTPNLLFYSFLFYTTQAKSLCGFSSSCNQNVKMIHSQQKNVLNISVAYYETFDPLPAESFFSVINATEPLQE